VTVAGVLGFALTIGVFGGTASAATVSPAAQPMVAAAVTVSVKPSATNTGVPAGTTLTKSGAITVTQNGKVIDGLDITGSVTVAATGVVIKNSRITGTGGGGVTVKSGSTVSITDTEISGFVNGITGSYWTAVRINVHGSSQDGVKLGSGSSLTDSWIHGLKPAAGAHADAGQAEGSAKNVVVRNNVIDASNPDNGTLGNSALIFKNDLGSSSGTGPVTIEGNWLNGGNYTLFAVPGSTGYKIANITIKNNRFGSTHRYGFFSIKMPVTASGNVQDASGAAIKM
jgi:hypothetical protein